MQEPERKEPLTEGVARWLKSDVTLVLPGWALAGASLAVFLLLILALD